MVMPTPKPDRALLPWRQTVKAVLVHPMFPTKDGPGVLARIAEGGKHTYCEFPGGGLNPGESVQAGLEREIKEETGVVPKVLRYIATVRQPWPESFADGDSWARKNYDKFQGSEIHYFTGEVREQGKPTSKEGDAWKPVTIMSQKRLLEHFASNPQPGWEPTAQGALQALNKLGCEASFIKRASGSRKEALDYFAKRLHPDGTFSLFRGSPNLETISVAQGGGSRSNLIANLRSRKGQYRSPQRQLLYDATKFGGRPTTFVGKGSPAVHTTTNPWVAHIFSGKPNGNSGVVEYAIPFEHVSKLGRTVRIPHKDLNYVGEDNLHESEVLMLGDISKYKKRVLPSLPVEMYKDLTAGLADHLHRSGLHPDSIHENIAAYHVAKASYKPRPI